MKRIQEQQTYNLVVGLNTYFAYASSHRNMLQSIIGKNYYDAHDSPSRNETSKCILVYKDVAEYGIDLDAIRGMEGVTEVHFFPYPKPLGESTGTTYTKEDFLFDFENNSDFMDPGELEKHFVALMFAGASGASHRGVSDTGLTSEQLNRVAARLNPQQTSFRYIVDYLDGLDLQESSLPDWAGMKWGLTKTQDETGRYEEESYDSFDQAKQSATWFAEWADDKGSPWSVTIFSPDGRVVWQWDETTWNSWAAYETGPMWESLNESYSSSFDVYRSAPGEPKTEDDYWLDLIKYYEGLGNSFSDGVDYAMGWFEAISPGHTNRNALNGPDNLLAYERGMLDAELWDWQHPKFMQESKGSYPWSTKEAQYATYRDEELIFARFDAYKAALQGTDDEGWYMDDVGTIGKEMMRRGLKMPANYDQDIEMYKRSLPQRRDYTEGYGDDERQYVVIVFGVGAASGTFEKGPYSTLSKAMSVVRELEGTPDVAFVEVWSENLDSSSGFQVYPNV